jgi:virulence-associated protein VagC
MQAVGVVFENDGDRVQFRRKYRELTIKPQQEQGKQVTKQVKLMTSSICLIGKLIQAHP